jgi:hypothetical protein
MSRAELAAACNRLGRRMDVSDIRLWEEGYHAARIENFGALARALRVSMEMLLYGEEEAERIAAERESLVSEETTPDA